MDTGAKDLSCYCPGCYMQLGGAAQMAGIALHYVLEEILQAFGDDTSPVLLKERAAKQSELLMAKIQAASAG